MAKTLVTPLLAIAGWMRPFENIADEAFSFLERCVCRLTFYFTAIEVGAQRQWQPPQVAPMDGQLHPRMARCPHGWLATPVDGQLLPWMASFSHRWPGPWVLYPGVIPQSPCSSFHELHSMHPVMASQDKASSLPFSHSHSRSAVGLAVVS